LCAPTLNNFNIQEFKLTNFDEKSISSDLRHFKENELSDLKRRIALVEKHNQHPEVLLYNFARIARTQDMTRLLAFHETYSQIINIPGEIVEIGVLEGQSLFSFAHFAEIYEPRNYTRKIVGFDSLKGYQLPGVKEIKPVTPELLKEAVSIFNDSVHLNQFAKIELVEGDPEESIPKYFNPSSGRVCALLILHSGLYDVEKAALEAIWPRMAVGAVVLLGSFGFDETPQCTQVIDDVIGLENIELRRFPFATKYCYFKKTKNGR
jgi:hypothetical protein